LLEALWPSEKEKQHPPGSLLDVLDELIDAQLLYEHGIHYHFRHALHRTFVYESASEARRRTLHAQVARSQIELDRLPLPDGR
jgi:hypothetical protein